MAIRRPGVGLLKVPSDSRYGLAMEFFCLQLQRTGFFRALETTCFTDGNVAFFIFTTITDVCRKSYINFPGLRANNPSGKL